MIVFDPAKDATNLAKHGVSLAKAAEMSLEDALIEADDRRDYGEPRWIAYGDINGRLHVLAFTVRKGVARPISLRRANDRERKHVAKTRSRGEPS